ncbi:MAG: hypothetical protein WA632_14725 [Gallionella sp.]
MRQQIPNVVDIRRTAHYSINLRLSVIAFAVLMLAGCGGRGEPALHANPQTIAFDVAPTLILGTNAIVSAVSTSGLPVSYTSTTPTVCSVNLATGQIAALTEGTCTVAANQYGNSEFSPAPQAVLSMVVTFNPDQTISFSAAPTLNLYGTAAVVAAADSGLAVVYSSMTPTVCAIDSANGVVTDIGVGDCVIAANQPGDASHNPAPQVALTLTVVPWTAPLAPPDAPTGLVATLGNTAASVITSFIGPASSGGSPVTGYTVVSTPAGSSASGASSPIEVSCPVSCSGYAFSVIATNATGDGVASSPADVLTAYSIVATFLEPDTQPNDSIFIGSLAFDSTTSTVSDLRGILSESMSGNQIGYPNDSMTWLPLGHQLSSVYDAALGGQLVTTFMLPDTNTFSTNPTFGGTDGWAPGTGYALYYNYPGTNPGNAYARIFVNSADPTAPLTQSQIDKLAYADCTPGGMMGGTCMTGTTVAGYGTIGSMGGYPVTQVITRK